MDRNTLEINKGDGIMKDLKYSNERIMIHDLSLAVPIGYKANENEAGENQNWHIIIPEDYSEVDNHIDAKPFGFGIVKTSTKINGRFFDYEEMYLYKDFLFNTGGLNPQVFVFEKFISSTIGALYQVFEDSNEHMWLMARGFIFHFDEFFQFHIYENYDNPYLPHDETTINKFESNVNEWLSKIESV